ncbi:MAG: DEAD/DEAH box helicase, partial [Arenimonas sp.]
MPAASTEVVRVALPVPLPTLFDYLPPEGLSPTPDWIGRRLRVPFGRGERVGVVLELGAPAAAPQALRAATAVLDASPLLGPELLETLAFCARYYHAPPGEVLATALPAALREGQPLPETTAAGWRLTEAGQQALARPGRGRPRALLERLATAPASELELELEFESWRGAARILLARGQAERLALPPRTTPTVDTSAPVPTAAQAEALAALRAGSGFRALLLEGVTGSGKTEVYLQAIRDCVEAGKQALVLVPEIGLTPQTLQRFRSRLGLPVWELHSGLADGERARAWTAMARGEGRVLVGTRSAIFTPLPRAGLIVVDEEHDASYKQQDGIRYHARDLALVRA